MLMITGHIIARPAEVLDLLADLRSLIPGTHAEDGCLFYDFGLGDEQAGRILVIERWRDQAALDAHLAGPAIAGVLGKWNGRTEMNVHKHDISNERGVMDS